MYIDQLMKTFMYERGIDYGIGSLTYPFIITMEHMRWSRHVLIIDVTLFICVIMFAENQINEGSKSLYWFCIDFIESKITAYSVISVLGVSYQYIPTSRMPIPSNKFQLPLICIELQRVNVIIPNIWL